MSEARGLLAEGTVKTLRGGTAEGSQKSGDTAWPVSEEGSSER